MKKKLLLMLLGVLVALPTFARDFEYEYEGQTLTYTVINEEDKTVMTKAGTIVWDLSDNSEYYRPGNNVSGELIIPEIVKDVDTEYTVTEIGRYAFYDCTGLTSVIIPDSVTTISWDAFAGCSALTSVTIPNSVTSIRGYAFQGCSGLTSVTIPNYVTKIGEYTFYGCSCLNSVTIPNSVTEIGQYAFYGCSSLTSVTIPDSVTEIGQYAFYGCSSLTSVIALNSVTLIGKYAFYDCSALTSVIIGNSVKSIGQYAFNGCSGLTSVTIPNSVTSIGSSAFSGCSSLTSVIALNKKPATIDKSCFEGLYDTAELTIPSEATWSYLNTLWDLFKNIRQSGSDKLLTVYNDGVLNYRLIPTDNSEVNNSAVILSGNYSGEISVPERFAYTSESGEQERYYVSAIGSRAFAESEISKIEFNSRIKLKTIGAESFYGCKNLTSIAIPESVTKIYDNAFEGCNGLTKAEFGSVEHICSMSFANSTSNPLYYAHNLYINGEEIKELVIPESVTKIPYNAFYGCSGLTSVTIPGSVTSIGQWAFYDCSGLTSVTIPGSVTSIGSWAFYDCSGLTSVTIPGSVTTIGGSAFEGCSGLTSVVVNDGTKSLVILKDAFTNPVTSLYWGRPFDNFKLPISQLETLEIGNTVTEIPAGIFSNNANLKSLTLGSGLTAIGDNAFSGCTGLTEVVVPVDVETIGASAFAGCSKLANIIMGSKVKSIGEKAFDGCPASVVSITAPQPPTAPNNTFSNYSGKLYLQGQEAIKAYYEAYTCWDRFDSYEMIEPTGLKVSKNDVAGKPGDTIQLTATLEPENVTLPQIFWRSTNTDVATVDNNGLVTFVGGAGKSKAARAAAECKIIAESLYAEGPVAEVSVTATSIEVTGLSFKKDSYSVAPGKTLDLNSEIIINPENATDKTLKWTSSDESVATVSNGVVTVLTEGTCKITATTADGSNLSATCTINADSGIEAIVDADTPCDVYSMSGILIMRDVMLRDITLAPGIYIIRQNGSTYKTILK